MDIATIKQILASQQEEAMEEVTREGVIPREGIETGRKALVHPNVLAVIGVRRCGKSIFSLLLAQRLKVKAGYVNFFDERFVSATSDDLEKILQSLYEMHGDVPLVILDEVQEVAGWERFVTRLRRTKKVIITGSNAALLQGDLATYLTGRHLDFMLYPFSFKEIVGKTEEILSTKQRAQIRVALEKYLKGSGFPEYYKFGKSIVGTIFKDIIAKDCLRRHHIREETAFRRLAQYLASNYASEFSYSKLSNIIGIKDNHTVRNYVSYLEQAFVFIVLERYSPKLKQQIIAPKKIYLIDHGFAHAIGFSVSKDRGKLYENIVLVELLRRRIEEEYYYFKSHQGKEVDFVVKKGKKVVQLIQVCSDLSPVATKERELKSLLTASRELRCTDLLVITDDYEGEENMQGKKILFSPLWKWLLNHR